MPYEIPPSQAKLVTVEWLDITGSGDEPQLTRRWSVGHLLSTTFISEGAECVVLGTTWDEDGWSDYSTFPASVVLTIEEV
jgi:hypothetical protein